MYVLPRADLGSRLDSSTEVALALYMNCKLYLEWLEIRLAGLGADNKLESCLYTLLSSSEVLAAIRARAIIHLKVVRPMRFFTNSKEVGFTPADMGPVVDSLDQFLCDIEVDGRKGMGIAGSGPAGEAGDGDDAEECGDGNGGNEEDENDEEDEEDEDSD